MIARIVSVCVPADGLGKSVPFEAQLAVDDETKLSYEYLHTVALPQFIDGSHFVTTCPSVGNEIDISGTTLVVNPFISVPDMNLAPVNALNMFVTRLYTALVRSTTTSTTEPTALCAMITQSE